MRANFLEIYQDFRLGGFKFHRAIHWYQTPKKFILSTEHCAAFTTFFRNTSFSRTL